MVEYLFVERLWEVVKCSSEKAVSRDTKYFGMSDGNCLFLSFSNYEYLIDLVRVVLNVLDVACLLF